MPTAAACAVGDHEVERAVLWIVVILGGRKPRFVEVRSSIAEVLGVFVPMPTVPLPMTFNEVEEPTKPKDA